jgi:hypothetical protein
MIEFAFDERVYVPQKIQPRVRARQVRVEGPVAIQPQRKVLFIFELLEQLPSLAEYVHHVLLKSDFLAQGLSQLGFRSASESLAKFNVVRLLPYTEL